MELPCPKCKNLNDKGYCEAVHEYLFNGYAMLYYSKRCGKTIYIR